MIPLILYPHFYTLLMLPYYYTFPTSLSPLFHALSLPPFYSYSTPLFPPHYHTLILYPLYHTLMFSQVRVLQQLQRPTSHDGLSGVLSLFGGGNPLAAGQHTLSIHPVNTTFQHTLSTHPVNMSRQLIPSTHPMNALCQHTLSTYPVNTPYLHATYQPTLYFSLV